MDIYCVNNVKVLHFQTAECQALQASRQARLQNRGKRFEGVNAHFLLLTG